jgi:hypothetical protein
VSINGQVASTALQHCQVSLDGLWDATSQRVDGEGMTNRHFQQIVELKVSQVIKIKIMAGVDAQPFC